MNSDRAIVSTIKQSKRNFWFARKLIAAANFNASKGTVSPRTPGRQTTMPSSSVDCSLELRPTRHTSAANYDQSGGIFRSDRFEDQALRGRRTPSLHSSFSSFRVHCSWRCPQRETVRAELTAAVGRFVEGTAAPLVNVPHEQRKVSLDATEEGGVQIKTREIAEIEGHALLLRRITC